MSVGNPFLSSCPSCGAGLTVGEAPESCPACGGSLTSQPAVPSGASGSPPSPLDEVAAAFPELRQVEAVRSADSCCLCRGVDPSGNLVAIHIFGQALTGTAAADAREFFPDLVTAQEFKHPGAIDVLAFRDTASYRVVVTEFIKGKPIDCWLRDEKPKEDRILTVVRMLCRTVQDAHERGITHRFLSPAAIFVDENDAVRIIGFGFANLFFREWQRELASREKQTQDYIAPELHFEGLVTAGTGADVFSIGVIAYELLAGRLPKGYFIPMPSEKALVEKHVDDAILRAMHFQPEERPENVAEFLDELDGLKRREIAPAARRSDGEETRTREDSFSMFDSGLGWVKSLVIWGTVGLLCLTGAGAVYWKYFHEENKIMIGIGGGESFLDMLYEAQKLLDMGQKEEAIARINEAIRELKEDVTVADIEVLTAMMIDCGEYKKALLLANELLKKVRETSPASGAIMAAYFEVEKRINAFLEAKKLAEIARLKDEHYLEYEALLAALESMPKDSEVDLLLRQNPVYTESEILQGIERLKNENPEQKEWRWHLQIERGLAQLDLSRNRDLKNLGALSGLPLTSLDLSHTGIDDLRPVAGIKLEILRIDGTKVADLEPLRGMPLGILSFEGTAVESGAILSDLEHLQVARGNVKGEFRYEASPPTEGVPWENEFGMRFRPLPDGNVLMAVCETRLKDYERYANATRLAVAPPALSPRDREWRDEGHTWKEPGYPASPDHPVSGVSWIEAEAFCQWLTERDRERGFLSKGQQYRLPTDWEWSQAAGVPESPLLSARVRGMQTADTSEEHAASGPTERAAGILVEEDVFESTAGTASEEAMPWIGTVGRFQPRRGFYDLGAGVREWCLDAFNSQKDSYFVRGGSLMERRCRPQQRTVEPRHARYSDLGFRVVLQVSPAQNNQQLPWLVGKEDWEGAYRLALLQSIADAQPEVRRAGRTFLDLQNFLLAKERVVPDSVLGLKEFEGRRYYVSGLPLPWEEANALSRLLGGHLATITSEEEERWILNHLIRDESTGTYWLGASTPRNDGRWKWVTGESWNYNAHSLARAEEKGRNLVLIKGAEKGAPDAANGQGANWTAEAGAEAHCFVIEWESGEGERHPAEKEPGLAGAGGD